MSDLGEMNRDVDDDRHDALVGGTIIEVEVDAGEAAVDELGETVPVEVNEADWLDSAAEPAPDPDDYR